MEGNLGQCPQYITIYLLLGHRMTDKSISPYRRRLNTEVLSKVEVALEAIKKHDMEQSRLNAFSSYNLNEREMLNELDADYSHLANPRKIEAEKTYSVNLFAHSQEFYYLTVISYVFPLRILLKNVRNDGVLFVGYDREYPGVVRQRQVVTEKEEGQVDRNFDYKTVINKDTLVTLKNKGNKSIKTLYLTFVANASLLTFNFKVEPLGFQRDFRFLSEAKLKNPSIYVKKSSQKEEAPPLKRQKTEPIQVFKQFARSVKKFPEITKVSERQIKIEEFNVFTDQIQKHQSKSGISPDRLEPIRKLTFEESATKSRRFDMQRTLVNSDNLTKLRLEKNDFSLKLQEIKRNKHLLEVYKDKDRQLRETANKCKKLIEEYKRTFNQENIRKRKLNRQVVMLLYSCLYIEKVQIQYTKRSKKMSIESKIYYLCKKFAKILKKKHAQSCNMLSYRSKRSMVQAISSIGLQSKLVHRHSSSKAETIIKKTLLALMPVLSINRALATSNMYRDKLKLIQRVWRSKYHSRMYSLLYFIDNHIEKMTMEYPHLKLFVEQFYKTGANRATALSYIKDQSEKYRYIYQAYLRKLQEIAEMVEVNKKIAKEGKKPLLVIPKKPLTPMHRFYRNCDILKSMARTWFQIEYKKFTKKSSYKYIK